MTGNTFAVWKFTLGPPRRGVVEIDMPVGAVLLRADVQADLVVQWALVEPERPRERRRFALLTTGAEWRVGDDGGELWSYTGTLQLPTPGALHGPTFVLHVFALDPRSPAARQPALAPDYA